MKYILFFLSFIFCISGYSQTRDISEDTTVYGIWDLQGKVLDRNGCIYGNVEIRNAILSGNPYIRKFDTTVRFTNCKAREFSTAWYGASSKINDNHIYLQKSIDACIISGVSKNLYIADSYKFSKTLKLQYLYNGSYTGFALNFYGDGDIWDRRTKLTYTNTDLTSPAIAIQMAKGGRVSNFTLTGSYPAPIYYDSSYYFNAFPSYPGYSGIVVDDDRSNTTSGRTGLKIEDIVVDGFDVLYDISPNGVTYNADIIRLTDIQCGHGRIGVRSNQAQEKGNIINNIASWGRIHTIFQSGKSGKFQGGDYVINGGNIAGLPVQLLDVQQSGWNNLSINDLYAESLGRIGYIGSSTSQHKIPITLNKVRIRFAPRELAGEQVLITSQAPRLIVNNSILWYYGYVGRIMKFSGNIIFDNCDFGASIWSNPSCVNEIHTTMGIITRNTQ